MFLPSLLSFSSICCAAFFLLLFVLYSPCDRFDGDSVENNPEAVMDKSKPWSRSIEDLHGGNTLQSPITGNGITRTGRHSTLRYGGHTGSWLWQKDANRPVRLCGLWLLTFGFCLPPPRGPVLRCSWALSRGIVTALWLFSSSRTIHTVRLMMQPSYAVMWLVRF